MPNDGFQENASITRTAGTPTTLRLNINASVFGFTDTSSDIEFFSIRRTLTVNGTALLKIAIAPPGRNSASRRCRRSSRRGCSMVRLRAWAMGRFGRCFSQL